MTIEEILKKCEHLKVDEKRVNFDDYDERVIYTEEIDLWNTILTDTLGDPAKPPGKKTSRTNFSLTVNYGGLFDDQTLFYKQFDKKSIIAMFWPWKDGVRTTLKIISFKE